MNKKERARQITEILNKNLRNLRYKFRDSESGCILRIQDFAEIYFPKSAGGQVAGGSFSWMRRKHSGGGIHEPAMVAAILGLQNYKQNVKSHFFDIGALYGYFSLIAASLSPDSDIWAFEMNPDSFSALRKNILQNRELSAKIHCFNVALSDRTIKNHWAKIEGFRIYEETVAQEGVNLDLIKLDDFCNIKKINPSIIKIDVEGYQSKIIPGAMSMIKETKPAILLEFDNGNFIRDTFNCTNKDVVKPLFDLGYSLFWCEDQRGNSSSFEQLTYAELSNRHEKNSLAVFVYA